VQPVTPPRRMHDLPWLRFHACTVANPAPAPGPGKRGYQCPGTGCHRHVWTPIVGWLAACSIRGWKAALNRFTIQYEARLPRLW